MYRENVIRRYEIKTHTPMTSSDMAQAIEDKYVGIGGDPIRAYGLPKGDLELWAYGSNGVTLFIIRGSPFLPQQTFVIKSHAVDEKKFEFALREVRRALAGGK